jgi:hypothetical protein
MSNELEHLRRFRVQHATVDAASLHGLKTALNEHIATLDRRAAARGARAQQAGRRHGLAIRVARRFALRGPALAATVAPIVVSVAVIGFALTVGVDTRGAHAGAPHSTSPERASRAELISMLGVLRSRQTPSARAFDETGWPTVGPFRGHPPQFRIEPDRPLIRLATVTPWGAKVFVVPLTSPRSPRFARLIGESAALWVQGIGWSDLTPAQDLKAGPSTGPGVNIRLPNGRKVSRFLMLVPDGIAKITIPLERGLPIAGKPVRFDGSISAAVHNNIAAFQTAGSPNVEFAIWYSADGRIIGRETAWHHVRRIGDHYVEKDTHRALEAEAARLKRLSQRIRAWCAHHGSGSRVPAALTRAVTGPATELVCRHGRPALRPIL